MGSPRRRTVVVPEHFHERAITSLLPKRGVGYSIFAVKSSNVLLLQSLGKDPGGRAMTPWIKSEEVGEVI